jgi:protein associated with RNAse G/E
MNLRPGDTIWVRAFKADGICYRWWQAVVEEVGQNHLVTFGSIGNRVYKIGDEWIQIHSIRNFYWFDRPYHLLEVYGSDNELVELYANVANLPQLVDGELHFTDYELDVSYLTGGTPKIIDQDEFAEAAVRFGYTPEFQQQCYQIAAEALDLVGRWQVRSKQSADGVEIRE